MPRNGSGVYSKPAGTTASPNTTIESAKYNAFSDDLVTDANAARPITAGGTGETTARLKDGTWRFQNTTDTTKLLAFDLSGLTTATTRTQKTPDYNGTLASQALGTAIASASSIDLGAASGSTVHITGTTAITALGTADAGIQKTIIFDGVLTFTHNATSLILPGAANITTAAGDTAVFVSEGSGNWRCLGYFPASPVPNTLNGQYKFPDAQNASSDPNTLDDYQETDTTPTVTSSSGTFTTVSCTLKTTKIGREVIYSGVIDIVNAGTAAGNIVVPLPYTAAHAAGGGGTESSATGFALSLTIIAATANLAVAKYDGSTIIASGRVCRFSGSFIPS